jgi:endogenous inhibitor of DNA gyrase (YacG/DUF329 family)
MVEFECPFCDEPVAVELTAFQAPACSVRCEGCSVELSFEAPAAALALAA